MGPAQRGASFSEGTRNDASELGETRRWAETGDNGLQGRRVPTHVMTHDSIDPLNNDVVVLADTPTKLFRFTYRGWDPPAPP